MKAILLIFWLALTVMKLLKVIQFLVSMEKQPNMAE